MDKIPVSRREYDEHKTHCSKSFTGVHEKLDRLERAMFGEDELDRPGAYKMITELHNSMRMAKGGQQVFWISVKIAGGISVIVGTFWAIVEFFKRVSIH